MPAALAVQAWPGPLTATPDGLLVIACTLADGAGRAQARTHIRLAARQALAGLLGLAQERVALESAPGQALRVLRDSGASDIGVSFSHEDGLSLAAINLHGAVGVDLMRVQQLPDWQAVARDYLGADAAGALARCPPALRAQAFAQAWTAREAALKCRGLGLGEWTAATAALDCRCVGLALPAGFAGTLATPV